MEKRLLTIDDGVDSRSSTCRGGSPRTGGVSARWRLRFSLVNLIFRCGERRARKRARADAGV